MNIAEYIDQVADQFQQASLYYGHGTDNAYDEALYLVCATLNLDFNPSLLQRRELGDDELQLLQKRVTRRIRDRQPVAYITGLAWFAGHCFNADARALVPRSPIAELIMQQFEPLLTREPERILDLCTGGGCIGIAAALAFPDSEVILADISRDALALADSNIRRHHVENRVSTVVSDVFDGVQGRFDLILSNPPYVSAEEVGSLPEEYRQEPELGLLSDDEGLAIPLAILRQAADFLSDDGLLIMEVGYSHELLAARLPDVPLLWLEFEHGGEGVFALTTSQLRQYHRFFN